MALLTLFSLLLACSIIGQAIGMLQIVHLVFIEHAKFHAIFPFVALLLCAITIRLTASYTIVMLGGELATHVKHEVRTQLLTKWTAAPFEQHTKAQTGEQVTLFMVCAEALDSYYRDYIKSLLIPFAALIAVFEQLSQKPSLSMEQALFCYTDGPHIGPCRFHIESGATGHGKTTLLHTLSGFVPLKKG